mmetsp:Transcript_12881/g.22142  ORF Transcript_12881/g.22142 Transcript_12881/m.22142 type:complete len:209 (-) Transcript_12881:114-740(-)
MMKSVAKLLLCLAVLSRPLEAFTVKPQTASVRSAAAQSANPIVSTRPGASTTKLNVTPDLDTVALVAGQENAGFAIVALSEAIWSFAQAPSFSHAKVLVPAGIAAVVLFAVSGPMIASGDAGSVQLGLEISTAVSALLGASYVARLAAPFSPSPKEAVFGALLIAIAGFISFSQNLVVDGFVTLPTLPSVPFPQIPLGLGEDIDTSRY